ncbi:MAG: rsmJ [Gammaproteobacteria bacterium]|jgi:16S rRNA (guanine1516-N2)-methyltransferase|nr:rsmJ [Gammaproteobacteria bacterium]
MYPECVVLLCATEEASMQAVKIGIFPILPDLQSLAETLAHRLALPIVLNHPESYDYVLVLTSDYIGLQKTRAMPLPLYVDFLSGKMHYRSQNTSLKNEALVRAMGLKGKTHPKIVDATGGLASDAFMLASLGFGVVLLERSPIIHLLVADGMQRAQKNQHLAPIMDRLHLIQADAISWLECLKACDRPDIIYLDPMFPTRKKCALPKQAMLVLRDIVGEDIDANELFKTALACALKRVVVKRPRLASALMENCAPSFSLRGNHSRFDVYMI